MTEHVFKIGWATLINAFALSSQSVTSETQDIYWQMLNKLPEPAFMTAITICLDECEFFPTVAKIREASNRKQFNTGALKQMQLEPPMNKAEATQVLRDVIARLPDKAKPKVSSEQNEVRKETNFAQFNRNYITKAVPCINCGVMCKLPFADGSERYVLCESCNT